MIFISHNKSDKPIVEPIAVRLSQIFGQDKVFYDSWSMQPGDGLIDKMNEGLHNCKFFFFFISTNSLNSSMVKLEWQNAFMKASKESIRFIPIRIDNSLLPDILLQKIYLDLFNDGPETTLRQMIDIINGQNTFRPQAKINSNLVAIQYKHGSDIFIECHAQYFLEPIPDFLFLTSNNENEIAFTVPDASMFIENFHRGFKITDGSVWNACYIKFDDNILPKFHQVVKFTQKTAVPISVKYVLHKTSRTEWTSIPMTIR